MDKQDAIIKLNYFKNKNKFSFQNWEERGLNPSDEEVCNKLEKLFNNCALALINAVESGYDPKKLKKVLSSQLKNFKSRDYDTEEKEFISDYFYELSIVIGIDFKENLNSWLYGSTINLFLKASSFFRKEKKHKRYFHKIVQSVELNSKHSSCKKKKVSRIILGI